MLQFVDQFVELMEDDLMQSWEHPSRSKKQKPSIMKKFVPAFNLQPQFEEKHVIELRTLSKRRNGWIMKEFAQDEHFVTPNLINQQAGTDNLLKAKEQSDKRYTHLDCSRFGISKNSISIKGTRQETSRRISLQQPLTDIPNNLDIIIYQILVRSLTSIMTTESSSDNFLGLILVLAAIPTSHSSCFILSSPHQVRIANGERIRHNSNRAKITLNVALSSFVICCARSEEGEDFCGLTDGNCMGS